jgi:hypothetical protein
MSPSQLATGPRRALALAGRDDAGLCDRSLTGRNGRLGRNRRNVALIDTDITGSL